METTKKLLHPRLLHKYQLRAFNRTLSIPNIGLFMEMGLGKTITVLSAIQYLKFNKKEVNKVLVIAPKRVALMVWQQEAENWLHTKDLKFSKVLGTEKQRKAALLVNADVYIINIDNIAWLTAYIGENWKFDMVVIDESSKIKNHASRRFKALQAVKPLVKRVVLLTGTPRPQGVQDLWSQIYMLDCGQRLGKSITSFRQQFLNKSAIEGAPKGVNRYTANKDQQQIIYNRIKDICVSMRTEDYLELPDRQDINVIIPITEELYSDYKTFERDKILEMLEAEEGVISAPNKAALSNKLRQYASGQIYDSEKHSHVIHDLKLDALAEILEDADGDPVLCCYAFTHDRDVILHRFKKYKPRHLVTEKDFEDWNAGKIKLALGHLASMGHGLNLQKAPAKKRLAFVFYTPEWNLDNVLQGITRIFRQGLKSKFVVYKLALDKTIDLRIIKSNDEKKEGQDELMQYVNELLYTYNCKSMS